jgi:penicillin-binding protein 2
LEERKLDQKFTAFLVALVVMFSVLVFRLFELQILRGEAFQAQAEANSARFIPIPARRGDILDRHGRVLATSRPVFVVSLDAYGLAEADKVIRRLAEMLGDPQITPETIEDLVASNPRRYEPVEIARLPWGDPRSMRIITRLEEKSEELPGVSIGTEPVRHYPYGPLAGHVLGYVGRITKEELAQFADRKYGISDLIGKVGLERLYESYLIGDKEYGLRGQKGIQRVAVDVFNRPVGDPMLIISPEPGANLVTTLDLDLQKALERSLDAVIAEAKKKNPKAGGAAAVVLDPRSGAILAMASRPPLDPNDFVDGLSPEEQVYYGDARKRPFMNRAVQGAYPPGSTFKMVTGIAALEEGVITPDFSVTCAGRYWLPPYIKCWEVHGRVNLYRALAVSCNTYFQHIGNLAGANRIVEVAKQFGFGQGAQARDVTGENAGLLPTPEWKKEIWEAALRKQYARREEELERKYRDLLGKAMDEAEREKLFRKKDQEKRLLKAQYRIDYNFYTQWQPFDTFNLAIGQGAHAYTVLQLASYVATLANGGERWQPYLVQRLVTPEGEVVAEFAPHRLGRLTVSRWSIEEIRKAMRQVTMPGGTAYSLFADFPPEIGVAAKTGTAQTGLAGDDPRKDFHGLFVAFAPFEKPEIALAVLVEYGESGAGSAGRVGREVLRTYFGLSGGIKGGAVEE